MPISFESCNPVKWEGFYRIPAGRETRYHASANDQLYFEWKDSGYNFKCPAEDDAGVDQLVSAVNNLKEQKAGQRGGGFIINEFGQVIVPYFGMNDYPYLVGTCDGSLYFEDPWDDDDMLTLNVSGYSHGDKWDLPYLGIKYNLSNNDKIYFIEQSHIGQDFIYLDKNYISLVKLLRKIRPFGGATFIVNTYGHIVMKKKISTKNWEAIYVAKLDYDKWYDYDEYFDY